MIPWYEKSFGREYLELYAHRDAAEAQADIRAIVRLISPPKGEPLLDLCCGACRHLLILREMGFSQLVGLDLSAELLEVGGRALVDADGQSSARVSLLCSDMRAIPYENYFATVLSLFTSFGYFDRDEDNQAVFTAVFKSLKPGGTFLVDYLNRDYVIAHLVERDEQFLPDRHVQHVRCLIGNRRRVEKTTTVITTEGTRCEFHESVRLYSVDEMEKMLKAAGFVHIRNYGSLTGQALSPQSTRLIIVAEKERQLNGR